MAGSLYIISPSPAETRRLVETLVFEHAKPQVYASTAQFLGEFTPDGDGCVVVPSDLAQDGTRALLDAIRAQGLHLRVVVLGRDADMAAAVALVRAGACAFLEPSASRQRLRATVRQSLAESGSNSLPH